MQRNAHKKTVRKMLGILACISIILAPLSETLTVNRAEAQARLVFDEKNFRQNVLQTNSIQALVQKERELDSIAYNISQKALQQMTADILSFLNTGNGGDPMFVTDWSDYLQEKSDKAAQEFLASDNLDTICDVHKLNVKTALTAQVALEQAGGFKKQIACSIDKPGVDIKAFVDDGVFSAGGYSMFFETILNPKNTALGAFQASKKALGEAQELAKWEAEKVAVDGFLPQESCSGSGASKKCIVGTPAALLAAHYTGAFNTPMQSLLNADEFDETIGSTFKGLSNEVLSGTNGLLGLSNNVYGTAGNQNYFDFIKNDPTNGSGGSGGGGGQTGSNPIAIALNNEIRLGTAEISIVTAIQDITRCTPDVTLPTELQDILKEFTSLTASTSKTIVTLADMSLSYTNSTSDSQKNALLLQLQNMKLSGVLGGLPLALQYEQFLNDELRKFIAQFKKDTNYVAGTCPSNTTP